MKPIKYKRIFMYFLVGALSTIAEWTAFWVTNYNIKLNHLTSTVIAIIFSTFINWLLGRTIAFRDVKIQSVLKDIAKVYLASTIGLALNLLLMLIFVNWFDFNEMLSKIIATLLVFSYNYLIRALVIYRK